MAGLTLARMIVQSVTVALLLISIGMVLWLVRSRAWMRETAVPYLLCLTHVLAFYITVLVVRRPPSQVFTTWSTFMNLHILFTVVGGIFFQAVLPHWRRRRRENGR